MAFETLHHMKTQKAKKSGFMAFKLDMSKACDRVEWRFLKKKHGENGLWCKMGEFSNGVY